MLSLLPIELLLEISNNFDIFSILRIGFLNAEFQKIFLEKKIRLIKNIKLIQKMYKNNRPKFTKEINIITKKNLVRIYIARYPLGHLLKYPEFLIRKIETFSNINKIISLKHYLDNKVPLKSKRTIRNIRDFLNQPLITINDILYTGW